MSKKSKAKVNESVFDLDVIINGLPKAGVFGGAPSVKKSAPVVNGQTKPIDETYTEFDVSEITSIPLNTYIRFNDLEGNLKPGGGNIKGFTLADNDLIVTIGSRNPSTNKYYTRSVKTSELSKVFAKNLGKSGTKPIIKQVNKPVNKPAILDTSDVPETHEEQILSQLGNKLLFDDAEMLRQKIDNLDAEVKRIDVDLKKIFVLVKRLYKASR